MTFFNYASHRETLHLASRHDPVAQRSKLYGDLLNQRW